MSARSRDLRSRILRVLVNKKLLLVINFYKNEYPKNNFKAGFTLIEIVIVLAIVSALGTGVYSTVMSPNVQQRTGDASKMRDLEQIKTALEVFYQDNNCFPSTKSPIDPASQAFLDSIASGGEWKDPNTLNVYMKKVPKAPGNISYIYKTENVDCPQYMTVFSQLSVAPTRFIACPIPTYSKGHPDCVPAGFNDKYGCVSSGTVSCAGPTPTPLTIAANTPTPTLTPTPAGYPPPCAPPGESLGYGDVDGNNKVNSSDAALANTLLGSVNNTQKRRADVDGDSIVATEDVNLITDFGDGPPPSTFPVCNPDATPTPTPTGTPNFAQLGWWKLDEASGYAAADSSGAGNNGTVNQTPTTSGLVGYWKFNDDTTDSSTSGINGTVVGSPTYAAGNVGNAISLNGTSQYVSLGSPAALNTSGEMSIFMWVRPNNVNVRGQMISQVDTGGSGGYFNVEIGNTAGKFGVNWGSTILPASNTTLANGSWYFVGFTRSGTTNNWTGNLYVNSAIPDKTFTTAVNPGTQKPTTIGRAGDLNNFYFNGRIDEVRIYNRAVTSGEISEIMSNSGPAAWSPTGGAAGGALGFNTGTWVNLGNNKTFTQNRQVMTVSSWIKPNTLQGSIVEMSVNNNGSPSSVSRLFMGLGTTTSGQIDCGGRSTEVEALQKATTSSSGISTGNWYYVVCIVNYSTDSVKIYINGVEKSTTGTINFSANFTPDTPSASSAIGSQDDGSTGVKFNGLIDDVKLFNYTLSSNQISSAYTLGPTPTPTPTPTNTPTPTPTNTPTPTPTNTPTPTPTPACANGYRDYDKDGYGTGTFSCYSSSASYNIVANNSDCNDSNAWIYQNVGTLYRYDRDHDLYLSSPASGTYCVGDAQQFSTPFGAVWYWKCNDNTFCVHSAGNYVTDCNDNNANIRPGVSDVCGNGIDEDCSGSDLACYGYQYQYQYQYQYEWEYGVEYYSQYGYQSEYGGEY